MIPTVYRVQIHHLTTGEVKFLSHTDLDALKAIYEEWAKHGWSWWEWGKTTYSLLNKEELARIFGKQASANPVVE